MQKIDSKLWVRFVPLLLVLVLVIAACSNGDDPVDPDPDMNNAPTVEVTPPTFEGVLPEETGGDGDTGGEDTGGSIGTAQAEPLTANFTAVGEDVDDDELSYAWTASDDSVELSDTTGTTTTATFTEAGSFEVTATVTDGTLDADDSATATIAEPGEETPEPPVPDPDPTGGPGDAEPTLGFFGIGETGTTDGTFVNDDPFIDSEDDPSVLDVTPAATIYARITASDDDGVETLGINIRNVDTNDDDSNDVTPLDDVDGFTLGDIQNPDDCALDGTETEVDCIYEITIADGTTEDALTTGEFAFVLRPTVNGADIFTRAGARGYVNIP